MTSPGAESGATRRRILDAALELASTTGLRKYSMEQIARTAKIGRATLYLYFNGKDALIAALVETELGRYFAGIQSVIDGYQDADDRLVHGFAAAYRLLRDHPAFTTVLRVNPELLTPYLIAENSRAMDLARGFVYSVIRPGDLPDELRAQFAEHVARTIHSFILIPGGVLALDTAGGPEEYARRFLLPVRKALAADSQIRFM
ncbi:TetR/AcrR family transcriptional regulator [Mycolicibacterium cosmeticum]|uniref:TetR/AcrR family transcriptional regulator n=1 Tax=Mycolicibacterium cosmeticum TaxID=258533 RepID=UPI003204A4B2